jgi:hypothetical protein
MPETTPRPDGTERIPAHSWYALCVLTVVYTLNFLDRVLVYILFPPFCGAAAARSNVRHISEGVTAVTSRG